MIRKLEDGRIYLVIGDKKYLINHPRFGEIITGRQLGQIEHGEYGGLPKAIYEAQKEVGVPHRFAWTGIINSMGDYAKVFPPCKPSRT